MTALPAPGPVTSQPAGQRTVRFLAGSFPASSRPLLARMLVLLVLGAIVQGIAFALAVPVIENIFTPGQATNWALLYGLIAAALVSAVMHHRSVPMGNRLGVDLATALHRAIAEQAAQAPVNRLDTAYSERLASLDNRAVVVILGMPGHFLRPLIAAAVTPLTVVVVAAIVEPGLGGAAAAGLVLLAIICYAMVRLLARTGEPPAAGDWLQRTAAAAGDEQPGRTATGRQPLVTVIGDVLLWRLTEIVLLAAVAGWLLLWTRGDLSAAKTVALIAVSVLMVRPLAEAVLLTSTVMKSRGVVTTIAALTGVGRPSDPPAAVPWPACGDVEFDDVGVTEWGSPVLSGVSFRIRDKTTTAVVGVPDGARLALGDLLAGDLAPTSGQVRIGGADIGTLAASDVGRHIQRLAQFPPDFTHADAASFVDILSCDGIPAGLPEAAAVSMRLSLSRLEKTLEQTPPAGEAGAGSVLLESDRWRLSLLQALARDPALVIVDGDLSALSTDPELAGLLTALLCDRTCLLLGAGNDGPDSDQLLVLDGISARF